MRDYAKIVTAFWTTGTGKKLRGDADAQRVAFYLMTCPHGNMVGIFYLPLPTLAHEIGMPIEGACKALQRLSQESFAFHDDAAELVFLPSAARTQIGPSLSRKDRQWTGVRNQLELHKHHAFTRDFLEIYAEPYDLADLLAQAPCKPLTSPIDASAQCSVLSAQCSESREQEQRAERESEGGAARTTPSPAPEVILAAPANTLDRRRRPAAPRKDPTAHQIATAATWTAYREAYTARYSVEPVRNAKVNGQIAHFIGRLSQDEAPEVAAHYVRSHNARYVQAGHGWGPLLADAEKLRTEWLTGRSATASGARRLDRDADRGEQYAGVLAALRAEDEADRRGVMS